MSETTKLLNAANPSQISGKNRAGSALQKLLSSKTGKAKPTEEMKRLFPSLYTGKASSSKIRPRQNIETEIRNDPERRRLYQAAEDFQAIFIGQMLKAMRKNLNPKSDPLYGGNRQEIFEDMLYDEYAKEISKSKGFNLADQIYNQLSRSLPKVRTATKAEPTQNKELRERYLPGQADTRQRYATERLRRQIEQAKNRISTTELYKEGDWRP